MQGMQDCSKISRAHRRGAEEAGIQCCLLSIDSPCARAGVLGVEGAAALLFGQPLAREGDPKAPADGVVCPAACDRPKSTWKAVFEDAQLPAGIGRGLLGVMPWPLHGHTRQPQLRPSCYIIIGLTLLVCKTGNLCSANRDKQTGLLQ